ncbi:MAG: 16S rRNA (cytidine(1402)-2'-O)-methyltransferase [Candidatus Ratteibacteria bacterium]|jgi:16S rRNA (cytidine1402-2'-O)-methyltransferase
MLYVVATPIGNLDDITVRALSVLREVDIVASEDTRETRKLLTHYGIHKPLVSYYRECEESRSVYLVGLMKEGKSVALVSDRGTPGISDPAHALVRRAREEGIMVVPVPGPSALTAALSVSGFPVRSFGFYGFPPRKISQARRFFEDLLHKEETTVFFESVHRFHKTCRILKELAPDRRIVVCRELTKKFEETAVGTAAELCDRFEGKKIKGEFVIIMEGKE